MVPHVFFSLAENMQANLHIAVTGENTHHMVEACFKGLAGHCIKPFAEMKRNAKHKEQPMIAIIDSGGANIASVQLLLNGSAQSILTRDAAEIAAADRVLLPGSAPRR